MITLLDSVYTPDPRMTTREVIDSLHLKKGEELVYVIGPGRRSIVSLWKGDVPLPPGNYIVTRIIAEPIRILCTLI